MNLDAQNPLDFSQGPPDDDGEASWLTSFGDLMSLLLVFFILMMSPQAVVSEEQKESKKALDEALEQLMNEATEAGFKNQLIVESNGNTAKLTLRDSLLFNSGRADFTPERRKVLGKILKPLETIKNSHNFEIKGHTDSQPIRSVKFPSNWYLSTARALAILDEFISVGFPPKNLSAQGFAQYQPLVPEYDENRQPLPQNRAQNRRVEIYIH